jgi:hypothetical protein
MNVRVEQLPWVGIYDESDLDQQEIDLLYLDSEMIVMTN